MSKKSLTNIEFKPLSRPFYAQNSIKVAPALLGKILVHKSLEGLTAGVIVETEAYHDQDPASHAFGGQNKRNAVMFGEAGHAYIYFIYGVHYCFNAVTGVGGVGEGVLIRALEPLYGISLMQQRRGISPLQNLTNGPAKLVKAMGITYDMLGADLVTGNLFIAEPEKISDFEIVTSPRIGITKAANALLRFYIKNNPYVSKK